MPPVCTPVASNEREVPPTANEVGEDERRGWMFSDRKASKVLGITVLRAPRLTIDKKASKVLGTAAVRSGTDWEARVNEGSVDARSRPRKRLLTTKIAPLVLGKVERERVSEKEGQKVVLSPKWKSSRMLRRHTILCESGPNPVRSPGPSSPRSAIGTFSPTAQTFAGSLEEDGGGMWGCSGTVSDDTVSETATLVDAGTVLLSGPSSCPSSPIELRTPQQRWGAPISPTARRNPVLQRRREMLRSANKSVQILGVEARHAILEKVEKENVGRIGWSGV